MKTGCWRPRRCSAAAVAPPIGNTWNASGTGVQRTSRRSFRADEPNRETGKNIWWQFSRADGAPWGLAGLWNVWTNKDTGEVHESYTMLTINVDDHALMRHMHKPDRRPGRATRTSAA
jgi:hypothetical protein